MIIISGTLYACLYVYDKIANIFSYDSIFLSFYILIITFLYYELLLQYKI